MNTVWIEVYRDTIEDHNEDSNLSGILVTEDFAEQYFFDRVSEYFDETIVFGNWVMNQDADDTMDFYQYAKEHDAIIEIKHY